MEFRIMCTGQQELTKKWRENAATTAALCHFSRQEDKNRKG